MRSITDIKNDILAQHIHKAERYPKIQDLIEEAEAGIRRKCFDDQSPLAYLEVISIEIEKLKELKSLAKAMKRDGYKFSGIGANSNSNYYEECFDRYMSNGKSSLKKLRPFVIEYLKDWTEIEKGRLIDSPHTSQYLKSLLNAGS